MKYRVLVNGRNSQLVTDLIQHTEAYFDMISTSDCWQDIIGHCKYFKPEVYLCFVEREFENTLGQIKNLKSYDYLDNVVVVLIGDSITCNLLDKEAQYIADLIIRRPVTPDNLVLRINRYFDEMNEAMERLKARQQELEERAKAEQAALEAKAAEAAARESAENAERVAKLEAKAAELLAREASESSADGEKKHILIVDDDRTVLKMLKSALGDTYEVTTMINGVMVDKLLETKKVDLMILDYEMPIETGADIFRRVKTNPKANHIPVCFLTGVSEKEKIMEVMSLKPHGYLLKPIDMDMLTSTVKNLIG